MSSPCLFCAIAAGEVEAGVVWSDDDFVAFLDIRPLFKGHTLLVPRQHVVTLPNLPAGLRDGFLSAAQRLATAMVEALGAQGSFVAMNNTVSQSVPTCTATSSRAPRGTASAASSGPARRTPTPPTGTPGRPA